MFNIQLMNSMQTKFQSHSQTFTVNNKRPHTHSHRDQ